MEPIISGNRPYFLDAITGAGNDSAAGTQVAPWATLAHADSVLPTNYGNLYIKYPNGGWYHAPPIWHGFLSYYPYVEGTFGGASQTTLYDIFNGHNGTFTNTPYWDYAGLFFTAGYVTVSGFANFGPTTSGAFIVAETNTANRGQAMYVGNSNNPRINTENPYVGGTVNWDFGSYAGGGRLQYTPSDTTGVQHVWGFLAGGSYQAIYIDATKGNSQNSNISFVKDSNVNLTLGFSPSTGYNLAGSQYAFLISNNTLPDASYLVLNSWLHNSELPNLITRQQLPDNGLERTPSMGWNSFYAYGTTVTETQIKANADAMVSNGMKAVGYQYVMPDDNWALTRTAGALVTNAMYYPSGMTALGTYIHGDGLLYGMYLGTQTNGCNSFPGSGGHESADATLIAGFGADFLKYDNCGSWTSNPKAYSGYKDMALAIRATGRNMPYLVSTPFPDTTTYYNSPLWGLSAGGNEVYSAPDEGQATWAKAMDILDRQYGFEVYTAPGRFNMPDYLGIGNGLTSTEGMSEMSLWAILSAPLWLSADLTMISSNDLATTNNTDVIAVDQDAAAIGGKRVSRVACGDANCEVYARQLSSGAWSVVMLNRASTSQSISATWSMFGQSGPYTGTDMWANWPTCTAHSCGGSLGTLSTGYTTTVASHGVVALKLVP